MRLSEAKPGETVLVVRILDSETALMAVRLGITEGEQIHLAARVPGGPLVVRRGNVEIALGREICQGIEVQKQ